jgi:acetyl esterase/lipase
MKKSFMFVVAAMLLISIIGCQTPQKISELPTVIKEEGIVFGIVDGVDLKLDLARPGTGKGPYPALVIIHGGGWKHPSNRRSTAWETELAAERGYVAVSVDYRFATESEGTKSIYPFPAQLHDVKRVVRWLRDNAGQYNIDPTKIGAYGYSFGGYLALLLGLTDSADAMEGERGNQNVSSKVQAVVNLSGLTDLPSLLETHPSWSYYLNHLVGGSLEDMPEEYKLASPITYISSGDPPVLTVHDNQKPFVPLQQAELLDKKMKQIGVSHTLIMIEGESDFLDIGADYPVWDFFDKHLKGRN